MWDVALRYAGEFSGFKFAAAAAYNEITGGGAANVVSPPILGAPETQYFQVGAYLQHVPTGLFVYGAYGHNELDWGGGADYEADQYYIKAGIRQRWTPLGHTVLFGEYNNIDESGFNALEAGAFVDGELEVWGGGIVQEIDNAAMSLWVTYRHLSYDDAVGPAVEDFQYVKAGALINF